MWVHICACTFTMCKASKSGVHTHCSMQFWHVYSYQWIHAIHKKCMSRAQAWFVTLHVWCTVTVNIATGNEMHLFCNLSVSLHVVMNSILSLTKYLGMSLLLNTWKCTIETRVKMYTCWLHYILLLHPLNISRKLKCFNYKDELVSLEKPIKGV